MSEQINHSLGEMVAPITTPILFSASMLDFWSHNMPGNQADLGRRAVVDSLPLVGPFLSEHIGNVGFSAAIIIPFTLLGETVRGMGIKSDNEAMQSLADGIELMGLFFGALVNLTAETFKDGRLFLENSQWLGDMGMGLGALLLAHFTAKWAVERYRHSGASDLATSTPAR